jgi:hypothetical protein
MKINQKPLNVKMSFRPYPTNTPTSFGQKRSQDMDSRFQKAVEKRKSLLKKEFASPDPLNSVYKQKGQNLDAQIRKLKDNQK